MPRDSVMVSLSARMAPVMNTDAVVGLKRSAAMVGQRVW